MMIYMYGVHSRVAVGVIKTHTIKHSVGDVIRFEDKPFVICKIVYDYNDGEREPDIIFYVE